MSVAATFVPSPTSRVSPLTEYEGRRTTLSAYGLTNNRGGVNELSRAELVMVVVVEARVVITDQIW